MAFGRKQKTEQRGDAAARPSMLRLFLPGAALGLLLFVVQGTAFDEGISAWSIGTVVASRLIADAVIGVVVLCALYIAFYAGRWILAQAWGWTRATVTRRGIRP
ncbi:MAG TPA: hypothetical protein VGR79_09505 [Stellaceae bacterium]|nr:hypothetical protein [Stellaceae bacterium]